MLSKGVGSANVAPLADEELVESAQRALLVDEQTGVAVPVILVEEPATSDDEGNLVLEEPQFVELDDDTEANTTVAKGNSSALTEAEMNKDKRTQAQQEKPPTKDAAGISSTMTDKMSTIALDNVKPEALLSDTQILAGAPVDVEGLTIEELDQIIDSLKNVIEEEEMPRKQHFMNTPQRRGVPEVSAPEMEEPIPLTSQDNEQQVLLKKDIEKFDNSDLGNQRFRLWTIFLLRSWI